MIPEKLFWRTFASIAISGVLVTVLSLVVPKGNSIVDTLLIIATGIVLLIAAIFLTIVIIDWKLNHE